MFSTRALVRQVLVIATTLTLMSAFAATAFAETTPTVPATITVTAVGDMTFSSSVGGLVSRKGPNAPFAAVRRYLTGADVTVGNLETPLSRRGRAVPGKAFTFRGSPRVTQGLTWAGFDLIGQGNNHARDFGPLALRDTINNLNRAGIAHAGAGVNRSSAFRPAIIERNGVRIAYLSYSQIGPSNFAATTSRSGTAYTTNLSGVKRQIAAAHARADYVIVSFHWGVERSYRPTSSQVRFGRSAIDAGADAVLSHHPHVIQGVEYYRGKLIAYSLGNFVFSPGSAAGHDTMILTMRLSPSGVSDVRARAMFIDGAGRPTLCKGTECQTDQRHHCQDLAWARHQGHRARWGRGTPQVAAPGRADLPAHGMLEGSGRGESGPEPIAAFSIRRLSEDQSHAQSALEYSALHRRQAAGRRAGVLGLALAFFVLVGVSSAFAAPPHRILSDEVLRDSDSMTAAQIQAYLNKQPGRLKSLVTSDYDTTITVSASSPNVNLTPDTDGVKKPASLIIWEACQQWDINPKVMLTMLQKEQSLLTRTSLKSTTLARAIGAGCPNGTTNRYPGFGNQMWHGARLLDGYGEGRVKYVALYYPGIRYWDIYRRPKVAIYPYSIATYKLYVYNPSISGNTSFWNIYRSRFGNPIWPAVTRSTVTRITGRSSVKARRGLTLRGKVGPAVDGYVRISMYRRSGGRWKSQGSARVRLVNGSYRYVFRTAKRGSWRFVARYSGAETPAVSYLGSKSRAKSVRVK